MNSKIVTTDTSRLQQATGYWSQETIFCNTNKQIVLLRPPDPTELRKEIISLREVISDSQPFKTYFEKWIGKNYLGALSLNRVLNKSSETWAGFQKKLRAKKYNKGRISRYMATLWWETHRECPSDAINHAALHRLPRDLAPLAIAWQALLSNDPLDFHDKISRLAQVNPQSCKQNYPNYSSLKSSEKIHACVTNLSMEERHLIEWALPFLAASVSEKQYYHATLCAIQASAAVLAWLRCRQFLLLPLHFKNLEQWLHIFGAWPERLLKSQEAKNAIKAGLFRLIASSTIRHIDDIPSDLLLIYGTKSFRPTFYTHLADWLIHPAIERKRPVFPIDMLQAANLSRNNQAAKWTPDWIKNNCNQDWYDFAFLWWQHSAGSDHKQKILKNFLEWALENRAFETPWEITEDDLRNPHRPTDQRTYQTFLKKKEIADKATCWSGSATMFRIVHQAAILPSSPVLFHGNLKNPFARIDNPFSNRRRIKRKTHRLSIPATIHELMIDTLYSPDENGYPTFSWAKKKTLPMDMVKVPDPDNPKKQLSTWCPSRTTCLAVLLLSPFRTVQARWLDQGLMDETCYDFRSKMMVPNQHPLREFIYPNGNTHLQQYGRASGVLQYSTDLIRSEETLCIFVNTNKTQLWDRQRVSGFEVPWPDGSDLLASDDPEQQKTGKWLARLYRVIGYQMQWMQRHNPEPHPLSFLHSHEDRNRVADLDEVKNSMPWFVPLFRDLSLNKYITDTLHGRPFRASPPVSQAKILRLYNQLAVETEKRFEKIHNRKIHLTVQEKNNTGRKCKFDLHSLRVTWISRLFEMGIPINIISEYIVGHATMVMTIHYLKNEIAYVREQLIRAAAKSDKDFSTGMEALWERLQQEEPPEQFLTSPRFPEHISDFLPDDFVAIVPVEGGICPMGGPGSRCNDGGILEDQNEDKVKKNRQKIKYGPVQGGCGNCRFFLTGPDFITEQILSGNSLMWKMRSCGRKIKQLYQQLDDIKRKLHYLPARETASAYRLETEKQTLSERIHTLNKLLEPLCIEWTNRYEMLFESFNLLKDSADSRQDQLTFIGNARLSVDDFSVEAMETTEFGLVRNIIEQARLVERQGYPIPENAGRVLREFMNIILAQHSPETLLINIPDEKYATRIASVLAGWLSDKFGEEKIQQAIDQRKPLPMTMLQNEKLRNFTTKLLEDYRIEQPLPELFQGTTLEETKK